MMVRIGLLLSLVVMATMMLVSSILLSYVVQTQGPIADIIGAPQIGSLMLCSAASLIGAATYYTVLAE